MRIRANRKNLKTHAKSLFGQNYTPEGEKELIRLCLAPLERTPGSHVSHDRADRLELIDKLLGNCGVEGMLLDGAGNDVSGECSMRNVAADIQYSNTGDTYALTIMYVNGVLCIGDWESVVEDLG